MLNDTTKTIGSYVLDVLAVLRLFEVGEILEVGYKSFVAQIFCFVGGKVFNY